MSRFNTILLIAGAVFLTGCVAKTASSTVQPSSSSVSSSPTTGNVPATSSAPQTSYSLADISKHNSPKDCWMAIGGDVYNVTNYINQHPGGDEILDGCGRDATTLFSSQRKHGSGDAQAALESLKIGVVR